MRPVRFVVLSLSCLCLFAAAGEGARPADPARQTLDKARAQIAAAAKGAKPGAPAPSPKKAAGPAPALAQAASKLAPLLRHKNPEIANEAAWLTALALSGGGTRDAPAARKACARLRQRDADGEFGGLATWLGAKMAAAAGDAPAARETLRGYVRRDLRLQATVNALETLGDLAAAEGKTTEAREAWQKALGCGRWLLADTGSPYAGKALPDCDLARIGRKLAPAPEEPQNSYKTACEKLKKGEFAAAETLFAEAVIGKWPEHELAEAAKYQIGHCRLGKGSAKEVKAAGEHWRETLPGLKTSEWQARCHFALGRLAFVYQLDWDEAEREFAAGAKLAEEAGAAALAGDGYLYYGICQLWRKDYEGAEKSFAAHLRHAPEMTMCGVKIPSNARFLVEMAQKKEYPVRFADKVMAGGKDNRREQAALFMAACFLEAGDLPKSLAWFTAVRDGKYGAPTKEQLAYAEMEIAESLKLDMKFDAAIAIWKKFENEHKATAAAPLAVLEHAKTMAMEGKIEEAVRLYNVIADRYPKSEYAPTALYLAGFAFYANDKWAQAIKEYDKLVKRYPKSEESKSVLEHEMKTCKENL